MKQEFESIPSGLITCLLGKAQYRILKISSLGLTIRTSERIDSKSELKVMFHTFNEDSYKELIISSYKILDEAKHEFHFEYRLFIQDDEYSKLLEKTMACYSKYVRLKNYGEDNEFSEEMVKYPAEKDYDFYESFTEQKMDLMMQTKNDEFENSLDSIFKDVSIAIVLNNNNLYHSFLENDKNTFILEYLKKNYFDELIDYSDNISRIYIGNEVCHNLFPDNDILFKMLEKCKKDNLDITICFTYLRECYIEKTKNVINQLYNWCIDKKTKIEIVINDWGMLKLLNNKLDYFSINLGILLNKRRKDPRYMYKLGINHNKEKMCLNSLNISMFSEFLKENNILRYEYESSGYRIKIADGKHSLHMPFYQTNTSQYCPLYAMCENLDRGTQKLAVNCPKYCTDYIFSYPKHLKMVGYYNSLFAFDNKVLEDPEILKYYIENGIDRIVLDFL